MSAHPNDPRGPDMSPWDSALAGRVQPVLSALFHDIMGPLSLIKNRVHLIRHHIQALSEDESLPAHVRQRVITLMVLLDGVNDATHRIHRGMAVPRDAVWESVLEGSSFDPERVIIDIAQAMKPVEPEPASVRPPAQL